MNSTEIASQLATLEQKEAAAIASLDEMVLGSQREIIGHATTWIESEVRRAVAENTAVVDKLGKGGLAKLKVDVKALNEALPRIVEQLATNKQGWRHHNMPEDPADAYRLRNEAGPDDFLRNAVSPLGKILHQYGLYDATKGGSYNPWGTVGSGIFRYKYSMNFAASKSPTLKGYDAAVKELLDIQVAVRAKRVMLEKKKALEAFESA